MKTLKTIIFNTLISEEADQSNIIVKGEAVANLISVVTELYYRGNPAHGRNDWGFNHGDYQYVFSVLSYLEDSKPDELPLSLVVNLINILYKYRRTQLPTSYKYDEEKEKLKLEVEKAKQNVQSTQNTQDVSGQDKIIFNYNDSQYGKIYVKFPSTPNVRKVNQLIRNYCKQIGMQEQEDQYGNFDYPKYKVYSKSKTDFDVFYIAPDLAKIIVQELYPNIAIQETGSQTTPAQPSDTPTLPKIEVLGIEQTAYGNKLKITLGENSFVARQVYAELKAAGHTPKIIGYVKDGENWKVLMVNDKNSYEIIKPFLEKRLDVSSLDAHFNSQEATPEETTGKYDVESEAQYQLLVDYVKDNQIKIGVNFKSTPSEFKDFFKQAVKYLFPDYGWDNSTYRYIIKGDYEQYVMLGSILKENFDVNQLRSTVMQMIQEGQIQPFREKTLDDQDSVSNSIDSSFENSSFNLYGLQKEGVNFLYKNKYAILGSETGGGKTVQMIYASELVYRETQLPILIVTLKRVQKQFIEEIIAVMGEEERQNISSDPMVTKKWNVLYYENFSAGKNLDNVVRHLSSQEYSVLILDELHKVKHSSSKRSQNIELIAQKAKNRWGATATISANKPQDVRNQLRIIGHPIGTMPEGRFKKEFSGMVPEGYGGAYVENPNFEERLMAAENLNKWLHLSGVYIRHSKQDMRSERDEKMPDLKIEKKVDDNIKEKSFDFTKELQTKIRSYDDPDLAISQLLAYRDTIATYKTNETIKIAVDIIKKNYKKEENNFSASKILIFTNFREAGNLLLEKATQALAELNPKWKAYSFLSATPKGELDMVKTRMEDHNSKILVMSMKMGGTGISFPNTFKTMLVNDYDWTPESVEQSEGRIYRINTNQDVEIIYNIDSGLDNSLYEKVEKKKELAKIIQTYRKIYQQEKTTSKDSAALKEIIKAQKELEKIEQQEKDLVIKKIPTVNEKFKGYFKKII